MRARLDGDEGNTGGRGAAEPLVLSCCSPQMKSTENKTEMLVAALKENTSAPEAPKEGFTLLK